MLGGVIDVTDDATGAGGRGEVAGVHAAVARDDDAAGVPAVELGSRHLGPGLR